MTPTREETAKSLRWLAGDESGKFSEGDKQILRRATEALSPQGEAKPVAWRSDTPVGGDARKLVTLEQDGVIWVGIRAWNSERSRWQNNNEDEIATVTAWSDLPIPYYDDRMTAMEGPTLPEEL